MKRITKHIEALLFQEECVVVPNLGAFIRHNHSARLDQASGVIYPGYTSISFNAALQQQDGLLVERYMKAFSYSYRRALALLESDVSEMKEELSRAGIIQVGQVGRLLLDKQLGKLTFLPNEQHPFALDFLGLQPLPLLPQLSSDVSGSKASLAPMVAQENRKGSQEEKGDIYYLPINLRHMRYGALATVAAACILLFSPSASDPMGPKAYVTAGFMQPEKPVVESRSSAPTDLIMQELPAIEESQLQVREEASLPETDTPVVEASEQEQLYGLEVLRTPIGERRYYIVIASLRGQKQLGQYMEDYAPAILQNDTSGVVVTGDLYRVFIASYSTLEEATSQLNQELRQGTIPEGSWVYTGR